GMSGYGLDGRVTPGASTGAGRHAGGWGAPEAGSLGRGHPAPPAGARSVGRQGVAGGLAAVGWPGAALLLFIALLPIHTLAVTLLLQAGVPPAPLRALAAWKELAVAAALLTALRRHGPRLPAWRGLRWPDRFALLFAAQACL